LSDRENLRVFKTRQRRKLFSWQFQNLEITALTGFSAGAGGDRIENMVRLFRATHLFSQEIQTLTEEFRAHCQLSAEVVSRMLAFEDYVNAQKKVGKVLEECRVRMESRNQRTEQLTTILTDSRAELQRL
jgi:exonuclease SbcC